MSEAAAWSDQVTQLASGRARMLARMQTRWDDLPSTISGHDEARRGFVDHACVIFDMVVAEMRDGTQRRDVLAASVARDRAEQRIHPNDSVRAARVLHEVILQTAAESLGDPAVNADAMRRLSEVCMSVFLRVLSAAAESHLSALLEEVADSHASERRRIARELHDQTGHGLAVAHRQLELVRALRATPDASDEAVDGAVETSIDTVRDTMRGVRALLAGLREDDDVSSLDAGLQRFVETSRGSATLDVQVTGDESLVPPPVRREAFLMMRETLRNAQRHARASRISLDARIEPTVLRVRTSDDGVGIDPEIKGGSGMKSLRERASLLDARIEWVAPSTGGTTVLITVPLPDRA